jgi:hypothetical protein
MSPGTADGPFFMDRPRPVPAARCPCTPCHKCNFLKNAVRWPNSHPAASHARVHLHTPHHPRPAQRLPSSTSPHVAHPPHTPGSAHPHCTVRRITHPRHSPRLSAACVGHGRATPAVSLLLLCGAAVVARDVTPPPRDVIAKDAAASAAMGDLDAPLRCVTADCMSATTRWITESHDVTHDVTPPPRDVIAKDAAASAAMGDLDAPLRCVTTDCMSATTRWITESHRVRQTSLNLRENDWLCWPRCVARERTARLIVRSVSSTFTQTVSVSFNDAEVVLPSRPSRPFHPERATPMASKECTGGIHVQW